MHNGHGITKEGVVCSGQSLASLTALKLWWDMRLNSQSNQVSVARFCCARSAQHRTVASSLTVVRPYCVVITTTPTSAHSLVQVPHKCGTAMAVHLTLTGLRHKGTNPSAELYMKRLSCWLSNLWFWGDQLPEGQCLAGFTLSQATPLNMIPVTLPKRGCVCWNYSPISGQVYLMQLCILA